MLRDGFRCKVPGCCNWLYLEVHHVTPFSEGGTHHKNNLALLCSRHHDMWHDGLLSATGTPETGMHWFDSMGRELGYSPPRDLQPEVVAELRTPPRIWGGAALEV